MAFLRCAYDLRDIDDVGFFGLVQWYLAVGVITADIGTAPVSSLRLENKRP